MRRRLGVATGGGRGVRALLCAAVCVVAAALLTTWVADHQGEPEVDRALSGGADATVFDATADAFARSVPKLSRSERRGVRRRQQLLQPQLGHGARIGGRP